jgi:hypothetical protein
VKGGPRWNNPEFLVEAREMRSLALIYASRSSMTMPSYVRGAADIASGNDWIVSGTSHCRQSLSNPYVVTAALTVSHKSHKNHYPSSS